MRTENDSRSYHRDNKYPLFKFTSLAVARSEDGVRGASAAAKSSPSHNGYGDETAQEEQVEQYAESAEDSDTS